MSTVEALQNSLALYSEMLESNRQLLAATKTRQQRKELQAAIERWEGIVERTKAELERARKGDLELC